MNSHVEAIVQDVASPDIGIKQSGSFINTYGELIRGAVKAEDQAFIANYSAQLYDEILKKIN